jgi:hypothetical protein
MAGVTYPPGKVRSGNDSHVQMAVHDKGAIMSEPFKAGDKVEWHAAQGAVRGTIKKKLTSPTEIKGHHVAASAENPEYLVVSDETGAEAAHKPSALKKL